MTIVTDVPVLWSDEALLAVNKPAGLPSLPDGYDADKLHLKKVLEPVFGRLWVVHRLDRNTSGVIILARSAEAHRALNQQFQEHETIKVYHALVMGVPSWTELAVALPLLPDGDRRHRTVVDRQRGKPAVTHLRILEVFSRYALVEARPETGRTHQIRVHLAEVGVPIVADDLYGDDRHGIYLSDLKVRVGSGALSERPLLGRLGLHARSLTLRHPMTGETLCLEAPYPDDLTAALYQLRKAQPTRPE